jgi:hypothetical protein
VRYVVSFGGNALAVPLVAWIYRESGGFSALYFTLSALAIAVLTAALFFPRERKAGDDRTPAALREPA